MVTELTRKCAEENAANVLSQDEYITRYNGYVERYNIAKEKAEALELKRALQLDRADAFGAFIRTVKEMDTIPTEFGGTLWQKTIDTIKDHRHDQGEK